MTPDNSFQDPALEKALSEIRDEAPDPAVVEAAANRVWTRLVEAAGQPVAVPIRGCAGFQALFADYRAGRLPQARAMLVEDHLHACVACRHVYEGKVVTMPAPRPAARIPGRSYYGMRWAAAAAAVIVAGAIVWTLVEHWRAPAGGASVAEVTGTLYQVAADGTLRPLLAGQALPGGVEIRTAKDSDAVVRLADGSQVELRERSSLTTTASANDLTVRLGRGSVMVEAAKRSKGHLFVDTGDCRVAVTGTIFGVSAGMKGSRVSVVQGEVHVAQGNSEKVLHRGDQTVTGAGMDPEPVRDDIAWSRNRERYFKLLADLRASLEQIHLPELRYQSNLVNRLPASTMLYASIPNMGEYLSQAEDVLNRKIAESPELAPIWNQHGGKVQPIIEKLRAASSYLGDEIDVVIAGSSGEPQQPVLVSELKRDGFPEFLAAQGMPLAVETRHGLVAFGPDRAAVSAIAAGFDSPIGGFESTPLYAQIAPLYREGAGLLICADLSRVAHDEPSAGLRYFVAEEKEVNQQMETRATLGFDPTRSDIGAWLADPAPMGALDYISPEAGTLAAFVVRDPAAIVDQIAGATKIMPGELGAQGELREDLANGLGGEFAVALDGPVMPVPSWKLVVEVYNPARVQSALTRLVTYANQQNAKNGHTVRIRTAQETVDGRTYYTIDSPGLGPLAAAHYTFADGYLIAAPSRALVRRALDLKAAGTSIVRSDQFLALTPRDHYANFSAVLYQNLGTQLAPLAGLLSGLAGPRGTHAGEPNPADQLRRLKPTLIAAYGAPGRITVASASDLLGAHLESLLTGDAGDWAGSGPLGQLLGTGNRKPAYREK
jgi:hypothetical protein